MTWPRESVRHSLAARGIPTAAYRAIRSYHDSRPVEERIQDENMREPLTEDIGLWSDHLDEYDIKGIDDPIPEGFELTPLNRVGRTTYNLGIIDKKTGKKAGDVTITDQPDMIYLGLLHVEPEYRKLGLSMYILRELNNIADKAGKGLHLTVSSIGEMKNDDLIKYYSSFGYRFYDVDRNGINMIRGKFE